MKHLFIAALLIAGPAGAHEIVSGPITIIHPFVKETPPRAQVGAGYMIIENLGDVPDRLIAIESGSAQKVEIHQSIEAGGMTKMGEQVDGLEIPAHGQAVLGENGLHAMFVGIGQPFGLGQLIDATLVFEHAGRVDISFEVEPLLANVTEVQGQHQH